jgi:REP element-mobilizing transposase RayT
LITFCCYGSRVPGEDNIVSRKNNLVGARLAESKKSLARASRSLMVGNPFVPDSGQREIVLKAIVDVCRYREWFLSAAHVRTTHVHVVVGAEVAPERVLHDLKSYASRALNCEGQKWARHGSTRYLWTPDEITNAVRYVVSKQGEPMAVYTMTPP